MLQKTIEKQNRKSKRKPPIPYTRVGKSKQQKSISTEKKYRTFPSDTIQE